MKVPFNTVSIVDKIAMDNLNVNDRYMLEKHGLDFKKLCQKPQLVQEAFDVCIVLKNYFDKNVDMVVIEGLLNDALRLNFYNKVADYIVDEAMIDSMLEDSDEELDPMLLTSSGRTERIVEEWHWFVDKDYYDILIEAATSIVNAMT